MDKTKSIFLCTLCALIGGALGYLGFFWTLRQGFYGLVLPGGLLGLGAGIFQSQARWFPFVTTGAAFMLGLVAEWRWAPFEAEPGFRYFMSHLSQLKPVTLIMLGVGAAIAFWVPFRRG